MALRSWKIGSVTVDNQLVLAPMEGVNCASFRLQCKEKGAGLIYTDMIDTKQFLSMLKENGDDEALTVKQLINPQKTERPLVVQLGGGEIEDLGLVTQIVTKHADIIDLNLGCPLGDLLGRKGGNYLMKHPEKLEKMIPNLLDNSAVPVTAKLRSGWSDELINCIEVGRMLERAGFSALALHARTRKQRYMARADWSLIKKLKESVTIPVIGNGDITKPDHVQTMLGQTSCDAVMIARGAQGNPDIFRLSKHFLETGERLPEPSWQDLCVHFHDFLSKYNTLESRFRLSELQDHAIWRVAGQTRASFLKRRILASSNLDELKNVFT